MSENRAYRDACRRQHRVIANYLAVEAWSRGVDCIVLERLDLEELLGLKRFKSARVRWMLTDIKPWFPYQEPYYRSNSPSSVSSLFLSRVPISSHLPTGSMTTDQRIAGMATGSPRPRPFRGRASRFRTRPRLCLGLRFSPRGSMYRNQLDEGDAALPATADACSRSQGRGHSPTGTSGAEAALASDGA